jgi:23S rRNA-/tRNA-specific pseudouridylate synthase
MKRHEPLVLEGYIGRQKANQFMVYSPDSREAGRLVGTKPCVSDVYVVSETTDKIVLLYVPHTGRTHQIRAQARYLGAPVQNDRIYGISRTPTGMLGLCAIGISFELEDQKIAIYSPLEKI